MLEPAEALDRLRQGNARFAAGEVRACRPPTPEERAELARGQSPWAVVLGCSDSRVPVELVFDQGPGSLFVVRVAGNAATPGAVGSAEFGVGSLGCRLLVVLGHEGCGAVRAALEAEPGSLTPHLEDLVEGVRQGLRREPEGGAGPVLRNARAQAAQLLEQSALLREASEAGRLRVVAAVKDLESGRVAFDGG